MNRGLKSFLYGALSVLLIQSSTLALDEEFKNSLIKIELQKINESSYNVDLYTQNQFLQPIKVIKKSDLNYYILLPETKNDTLKTTLNGTDIRNVSIDLYPYAGQGTNNGYTKININTTKPINFNVNMKNTSAKTNAGENLKTAQTVQEEAKLQNSEVKSEKKNSDFQISKETETTNLEKQNQKTENEVKIEDLVQQEVEKARKEAFQNEFADENFQTISEEDKELDLSEEEIENLNKIGALSSFDKFKNKLDSKLAQYNLRILDIFFIFLIMLLSILTSVKFLNKKQKQTRLKSRAELINSDKNTESENQQTFEKIKTKNDGQYFVFDKNIKQTGFCDPSTSSSRRNYELSSYEPDLKDNYKKTDIEHYQRPVSKQEETESEYDIIQKILKSDSFLEIEHDEFERVSKTASSQPIKQPQSFKPAKKEIKETIAEPTVLSEIEIAPKRGFMCVSYNDNISLMGYIFDDVFALYNFKQPKLENYEIKYRLTEKDTKGASFIVKVGEVKMLIKVTKSSMNMEVLL